MKIIQDGELPRGGPVPQDTYDAVLRHMVIVCADVVVVDRATRRVYLAQRTLQPYKGWWVIGGRQLRGETNPEAAVRHFKHDTGVSISVERLELVCASDYMSPVREQEPREVGSHTFAMLYAIELTPEELAPLLGEEGHLRDGEYTGRLRPFNRGELSAAIEAGEAHPVILRSYDAIFP